MTQKPATPLDIESKLDDYRDIQDAIDKAIKKQLEITTIAQKAEIAALYKLAFDTNKSINELRGEITPMVQAWGDGKIVGKVMWVILKGTMWLSLFIAAVSGAILIIKEAFKR